MLSAMRTKLGLQEFCTALYSVCEPCPPCFQHFILSPFTMQPPSQLKPVSAVTLLLSSAAASVISLNVEPGSYESVTTRLRISELSSAMSLLGGELGSKSGWVVSAFISPVVQSIIIPCTLIALFTSSASLQAFSSALCITASVVSTISSPSVAGINSCTPYARALLLASVSVTMRPSLPARYLSYFCSSPACPSPSTVVKPKSWLKSEPAL